MNSPIDSPYNLYFVIDPEQLESTFVVATSAIRAKLLFLENSGMEEDDPVRAKLVCTLPEGHRIVLALEEKELNCPADFTHLGVVDPLTDAELAELDVFLTAPYTYRMGRRVFHKGSLTSAIERQHSAFQVKDNHRFPLN